MFQKGNYFILDLDSFSLRFIIIFSNIQERFNNATAFRFHIGIIPSAKREKTVNMFVCEKQENSLHNEF